MARVEGEQDADRASRIGQEPGAALHEGELGIARVVEGEDDRALAGRDLEPARSQVAEVDRVVAVCKQVSELTSEVPTRDREVGGEEVVGDPVVGEDRYLARLIGVDHGTRPLTATCWARRVLAAARAERRQRRSG